MLTAGIGGHIAAFNHASKATDQREFVRRAVKLAKSSSGDLAGAVAVQLGAIRYITDKGGNYLQYEGEEEEKTPRFL